MFRPFLTLLILLNAPFLQAQSHSDGEAVRTELLEKYQAVRGQLHDNDFGLPIVITSIDQDKLLQGEIIGIIEHNYSAARQSLLQLPDWCDTLILHLNTKACSYENDGQAKIHLYSGRKYYETPVQATRLTMNFNIIAEHDDFLWLQLHADKGPLGTRDYRIEFQAMPLITPADQSSSATQTLVRLTFSYRMNWLARKAMSLYLGTLARDKIGFTVIGTQYDQPVYIDGVQGIIERNTVRYFLAVKTHLDALAKGASMEQQFSAWFNATERYHLQLHEVEKDEYLNAKQQELHNQRLEQQRLDLKIGLN